MTPLDILSRLRKVEACAKAHKEFGTLASLYFQRCDACALKLIAEMGRIAAEMAYEPNAVPPSTTSDRIKSTFGVTGEGKE